MEDLILNKNKVKIGSREIVLSLPSGNGAYFDKSDINEFGYPNTVNQQQGEFYYWHPSAAENVVICLRYSGLGLDIYRDLLGVSGGLGVPRAKFFS